MESGVSGVSGEREFFVLLAPSRRSYSTRSSFAEAGSPPFPTTNNSVARLLSLNATALRSEPLPQVVTIFLPPVEGGQLRGTTPQNASMGALVTLQSWCCKRLDAHSVYKSMDDQQRVFATRTERAISGAPEVVVQLEPEAGRTGASMIGSKRKASDEDSFAGGGSGLDERPLSRIRGLEPDRLLVELQEYIEGCDDGWSQVQKLELDVEELKTHVEKLEDENYKLRMDSDTQRDFYVKWVTDMQAAIDMKMARHAKAYGELQLELEAACSECSGLRTQRKALEQDVCSLQAQVGQLESAERVNARGTSGFYLDSAANPNDVQHMADKIKQELASFTRALMFEKGHLLKDDAQVVADDYLAGSALARQSDVKFCFQGMVSDILFCGFEYPDFLVADCLPPELELEKILADNYRQYKALSGLKGVEYRGLVEELAAIVNTVRSEESCELPSNLDCPQGCSQGGYCVCGLVRFLGFCHNKVRELMTSKLGKFWSQPAASCRQTALNLSKQLLPSLSSVWRSHLLVFSFEHYCSVVKLKREMLFDPAYIENSNVAVGDDELDAPNGCVPKVVLMTVPGFRIGKLVVKAQAYVQHL